MCSGEIGSLKNPTGENRKQILQIEARVSLGKKQTIPQDSRVNKLQAMGSCPEKRKLESGVERWDLPKSQHGRQLVFT